MRHFRSLFVLLVLISITRVHTQNKENQCEAEFIKSAQTLGDTRVFGIAISDMDADGDNDIFLTNYIGPSRLWLNDGSGNFTESSQDFGNSEAHAVSTEDFNGDEYPDIFLLNHAGPCKVFFNNGKGIFTDSGQSIGKIDENPGMIGCGDIDNDGDRDAVITYYKKPLRMWINNGKGFFTEKTNTSELPNGDALALIDVNGDKNLDLFICLSDQPDEIWINNGAGIFSNSMQKLGNSVGYEKVESGDIDGDGYNEFVVSNSNDGIIIFRNQDGKGKFVEMGGYFEPGHGLCKLFDADLDKDLDLFIAGRSGAKILINNGKAVFSAGQLIDEIWVARAACGRFDNDKDYDIVLGKKEGTGGNKIYFNESSLIGQSQANLVNDKYLGQTPPGSTPVVFAPGIVSTAQAWEAAISFSPDGREILFTRRENIDGTENRIFNSILTDGKWTAPKLAPFARDITEYEAFISPDGKKVYYNSDRTKPASPTAVGEIWYSERTQSGWSDGKYLTETINKGWVMFVTSSMNNNLYFTAGYNRKFGIYKSEFINGSYREPEYLPDEINYLRGAHPFIAPDESYLIFDAQPDGMGKSQLFISFKDKLGKWSKAVKFDDSINKTYTENIPNVSPDGRYFFFHRNNDIYWVSAEVIEKLRPKQ